jgi:hypothetical protein
MVRLLDYRRGRELYRWRAAPSSLRMAFYSASEHRLSVLTTSGDIHIWDVSGLEASPANASASTESGANSSLDRHPLPLQTTVAGTVLPLNAEVQHVLLDIDADFSVLSTPNDGLALFRGHTYRMTGFRPAMSTRGRAGRWFVSDGRSVLSMAAGVEGAQSLIAETVWKAKNGETVSQLVALINGGIAVVLPSLVALLAEDGTELARTSRAGVEEAFAATLVRGQLDGDVLVLENSACEQRRIHVPTGRLIHAPDRVCE